MNNSNNIIEILSEILIFDNEIEKLNMEIRSELLAESKIDANLYFKKLNGIIKEYESSLNSINKFPKSIITPNRIS